MSQIEVTIPLIVEASMTLYVDAESEVTPEWIQGEINAAQRTLDRRGDDPATGIYLVITGHGEPGFEEN